MVLLYFEGLGFLVGFGLSLLGKKVFSREESGWRWGVIGVSLGILLASLAGGVVLQVLMDPEVGFDVYSDYLLGFVLLGFPGWGLGLLGRWVLGKRIQ